jgi:Prealbumin-like fold domain
VKGYTSSLSADCTGKIAVGESKTCTLTNDDQAAKLTVVKKVVNDDGGTTLSSSWKIHVRKAGTDVQGSPQDGSSSGTTYTLSAGTYTVDETNGPSGYNLTFSDACSTTGDVTLKLGDDVTCTLTNNDIAPKLTVIKHVVNNDGGSATASAWSIHVKSGSSEVAGSPKAGKEAPGDTYTLKGGTYTMSETGGSAGYFFAGFSGDCSSTGSITLQVGQSATCTLTNNDQPRLVVIKHVINNDGQTATASQFTMKVNGKNASPSSFPGSESGTTVKLDPGAYGVTEDQAPSETGGYVASFSADCAGSIQDGQKKTCTVTNDDFRARRTPGYWKNHQSKTSSLLPITLGNYTVDSFTKATAVFNKMNCSSTQANDAVGCLAGHLLASKLNVKNGTDACIAATITAADKFLKGQSVTYGGSTATGITYTGPSGNYQLTNAQRKVVIAIKNDLDRYNNNIGCP